MSGWAFIGCDSGSAAPDYCTEPLSASVIVGCSPLTLTASAILVTGNINMSGSEWAPAKILFGSDTEFIEGQFNNDYLQIVAAGNLSLRTTTWGDIQLDTVGDRIAFFGNGNPSGEMDVNTSNEWKFKDASAEEIFTLDASEHVLRVTGSGGVRIIGRNKMPGTGSFGYLHISGAGMPMPMPMPGVTASVISVVEHGSGTFTRGVEFPPNSMGPGSPPFQLSQLENERGLLIFSASMQQIFASKVEFEADAAAYGELIVGNQLRFSGSSDRPAMARVVTGNIDMTNNPARTYAVFSASSPLTATIGPVLPGAFLGIKRHQDMLFDVLISSSGLNSFDGDNDLTLTTAGAAVNLLNLSDATGAGSNWYIF